jgi:hypothetical protein
MKSTLKTCFQVMMGMRKDKTNSVWEGNAFPSLLMRDVGACKDMQTSGI